LIDYKKARKFGTLELLAKQVVEGFITGLHKSPFHGFSVEFAEHRLYNNGESTKHLDWKLFARTDKLFIKRYEEETNLRCQLVIDASSSMRFPVDQPYNKLSFSVDAAAALVFLMRKQRDAVGVTMFSNELDFHSQAKSSLAHQRHLLSNMEKLMEEEYQSQSKRTTDLPSVINRLAMLLKKRSLVFVFSDFMGMSTISEFADSIKHLCYKKHEVVVFDVSHHHLENELGLKNKYYNFVDMESGETLKLHPREIQEKYKEQREKVKQNVQNVLLRQKVDVVNANIEDGFNQVLLEYLIKRKKMI